MKKVLSGNNQTNFVIFKNKNKLNMSEQQRLDTSLTSMDWLSRLNTNKHLMDDKITFNNTNNGNSFNFFQTIATLIRQTPLLM